MVLHSMTNIYYSQTVLVVWWNQTCCLEITPTSWQTSISVWNGIGIFSCIFIWHKLVFYMLCSFTYIHMPYKICFNHTQVECNKETNSIEVTHCFCALNRHCVLYCLSTLCALLLEHKSLALVTLAQIFDVIYRYLNTKIR